MVILVKFSQCIPVVPPVSIKRYETCNVSSGCNAPAKLAPSHTPGLINVKFGCGNVQFLLALYDKAVINSWSSRIIIFSSTNTLPTTVGVSSWSIKS